MAHGEAALRPDRRKSNFALSYKVSEVHYEPLGVVAGIVSWNYRAYYRQLDALSLSKIRLSFL